MAFNTSVQTGEKDVSDLVVIGAGAGGMTTALVAALQGLSVTLCEATEQVGGTTATSAGTIWIPGNRQSKALGLDDSLEKGCMYLDAVLGKADPHGRRNAYLSTADEAIAFLESRSEIKFVAAGIHPDYLQLPGAATSGRALGPAEFDGRRLGSEFNRIRPPLQDLMILGGMMAGKADVKALIGRYRTWNNFFHSVKLLTRYGRDRLSYRRGTRLVLGNALIARLYYSLRQAGVKIRFNTQLCDLVRYKGRVTGALVNDDGTRLLLHTRLGVVLATGGIGHHHMLRSRLSSDNASFTSLAFERNRGDGIVAAQRAGAALDQHKDSFFWQPVSRIPEKGGGERLFPHLYLDRTKPGIIAVDATGNRFVNEAASYHHFVEAMRIRNGSANAIPCYFICDSQFVRSYGLGIIAPGTRFFQKYVESGYVKTDPALAGLAKKIGVDSRSLLLSIKKNNQYALTGYDADFGKGSTLLNTFNGDPDHKPNPCLGQISIPPFFALAIWPADAASSTGLATDADGVVLDENGSRIGGLYACGNDMASIMNGAYPGPGITIGPAMVFGYRIALHAKRTLSRTQEHLATRNFHESK